MPDITRPVPITIHPEMYPAVRKAAIERHDGNISDFIRTITYKWLLNNNDKDGNPYVTQVELIELFI